MTKKFSSLASASALAFGLGLAAMPAPAHAGFFEQLFGIAPQAAPQAAPVPAYGYDAPQSYESAPVHRHIKHKVVDEKPKLQKPTDLMHDATLQTGDAIMMKSGLKIYVGSDGDGVHDKADFRPLDAVRGVPKEERKVLVTMDTTRNDPLRGALNPDTIASGRSAAVASPVSPGHDIVDARGKTLRYVGP